jgi:methionyl-tRNA formyltransferase
MGCGAPYELYCYSNKKIDLEAWNSISGIKGKMYLAEFNIVKDLLEQSAKDYADGFIAGRSIDCVTTFKLQHAIDTGDILLQKSFLIGPDDTTGEVHDKMKDIGASVLVETVRGIAEHSLKQTQQSSLSNESDLKHAPKLFTENCAINWNQPIDRIHNFIRGLSPFPGALSKLDDKILKIYKSKKEYSIKKEMPGSVFSDGKTFLKIAAEDGYIHLLDLQLEGKKRMLTEDFLRGYRLANAPS